METEEVGMDIQDKVAGFIFMCNRMTKPECYRFRVFALPAGRTEIVKKINPGAYLFLFDTDVKLLYGIYLATSAGMLNLEPLAFGGRFPAQVKFKIYKDCLPLPENQFKHAIKDNYKKHSSKFDPELNIKQVRSLLELFRPLDVSSSPAPTPPVLNEIYSPPTLPSPPVNGVFQQTSRTSLTEDSILSRMSPNQAPRQLNYQHVNELGKPTGSAYPVNNLMPNSVAAQFVSSQASGNQTHVPPILNPSEFHSSLMQDPQRGYAQSWQDSQRAHLNVLHPQPEFHSSMRTIGNNYAPSMQDPQHAHFNALHPQHMGNSYAQSMQDPQHAHLNALHPQLVGNSYPQSMQDPQHAHHNVLHPQPGSHPSTWNMGNSYAQSLQHSQHAHLNVLQPHPQQPEFHSSMMTMGNSYAQPLKDPQHPHQSIPNPPHGFHHQMANVGSGHAQMWWDPHGTHQNIPYLQPDAYSNTANMGSSYAQSFPNPQHAHQNAQNLQPHLTSSVANMNHANVAPQSHAQSVLYYPYVPQQVTPATYSNQTGAIQELIYSGQQTGTGSQYYQSSMQTENASTAENVVSHLH